jgi:hypothetical protein
MQVRSAALALLGVCLCTFGPTRAADNHQVVILDIGRWPNGREGSDHHRLLVLDIESAKVTAHAVIGFNSDIAVSPGGDLLTAISYFRGEEGGQTRMQFFRAQDLKRLEGGLFPSEIHPIMSQLGATKSSRLLPGDQGLIVQSVQGNSPDNGTTSLTVVKRELDGDGAFKVSSQVVKVRSYGVGILRVADWPRVHIVDYHAGLLKVVDFKTGKTLSRLPLADDPALDNIDPADLEKPDNKLIPQQLKGRGRPIAGEGRYAYLLPYAAIPHPAWPLRSQEPGFLRKIDLTANPPKVILKGEKPVLDIRWGIVSESAGFLFVVQEAYNRKSTHEPSKRIKIFSAKDLKLLKEIDLSINDCHSLAASYGSSEKICNTTSKEQSPQQ